MRKYLLLLLMVFALVLSACGQEEPTPSEIDEPPVPPAPVVSTVLDPTPPTNPLTGLPIDEAYINTRPYAIMLNNLKQALPQLGNSKADIIYEVLAEGGITRMLGLYKSVDEVGTIGSVRSSRPYYLELALGHDAIYLHAGGSDDAYAAIEDWNVTALDCVRGPHFGTIFWRDAERRQKNGSEHSIVTTGEAMLEHIPTLDIRHEHEPEWEHTLTFAEDGTPAGGEAADVITVPFSSYKTGVFIYDAETKRYAVEEYGAPLIDGNDNSQVAVTNVLVLKTDCHAYDDYGRMVVDLESGGEGWFACGGKVIPIHWEKGDHDAPFVYTTADGKPLALGMGQSYVNIIPLSREPEFA